MNNEKYRFLFVLLVGRLTLSKHYSIVDVVSFRNGSLLFNRNSQHK